MGGERETLTSRDSCKLRPGARQSDAHPSFAFSHSLADVPNGGPVITALLYKAKEAIRSRAQFCKLSAVRIPISKGLPAKPPTRHGPRPSRKTAYQPWLAGRTPWASKQLLQAPRIDSSTQATQLHHHELQCIAPALSNHSSTAAPFFLCGRDFSPLFLCGPMY